MAAEAAIMFAGKLAGNSVANATISFWINKAFTCLTDYCKAESLEDVKGRVLQLMNKIQVVFEVIDPEDIKKQSSALNGWLWKFRDAVEEAEDVIDELNYYERREKAKDHKVSDWGSSTAKLKHKFVKSVKHVGVMDKALKEFTHRGTLKRLKKALEGLEKAATEIVAILTVTKHLKDIGSGSQRQLNPMNNDHDTGSTMSEPYFVGREEEKQTIVRWLTRTPVEASEIVRSTHHVPILSVVGHGGMGKTTLAQYVCEVDEVVENFKVIWVHVSARFNATSVTSKILESVTGVKPGADHLEALQQKLKQELRCVKFFLVLDDVWEDKKKKEWESIFASLRKAESGSKILVTTRMKSVADMAANAMGVEREYLELEGLKEDENLKLFNHHVYSGRDPQDFVDLKFKGEELAKQLGGCPLVTKVVSGYLQCNMSFECWNSFLQEGLVHFKGSEDDVMETLRLSYYCLPAEVQICFRYCSIFPQDYEFKKKDLVLMWMGSGLISQDGKKPRRIEDIGEQILAELTRKSFFEMKFKVDQHSQRKEEYYIMHDLMHELAKYVSAGECTTIVDPSMLKTENDTVRHLRIACIDELSTEEVKKITHFKNLRTIIIDGPGLIDKDVLHLVENAIEKSKSLRLLRSNLENTFHLPKLADLKHLRYVYLHRISLEGMCGLVKLYHLLLVDCLNDSREQSGQVMYFANIDHLRYVNYGARGIGEFPIGRLTSLQELHNYYIQGSKGNKISAVKNLRTLRELDVFSLENVESLEEADNAKLNEKRYLNSLSLMWSARANAENGKDDLVLDHLEPHANIRNLKISGYCGIRLPLWIENLRVKNLVSLELARCIYWEQLPSLGELECLKKLWLECLPSLQQIGQSSQLSDINCIDSYLPPHLDTLIVRRCKELKQLPILPPSLVHMDISKVGLTKFPRIGNLNGESIEIRPSKLQFVSVKECESLTLLEDSLLLQIHYIRTIHVLCISDCKELESAPLFGEMSDLRELSITICPKLRASSEIEGMILSPSVKKLTIKQSGDLGHLLMKSLHGLANLSELVLENCPGLRSLPSADVCKCLKSLKFLEIIGCENLSSLGGLGSLRSLIKLKISSCSNLTAPHESDSAGNATAAANDDIIEEGNAVVPVSSLQIDYLKIDLPSVLNIQPLSNLCHTKGLVISGGTQMESLPEQWLLQNRKELQSLKVLSARSLESLPLRLRDLRALNFLLLSGAEKLRSLPDLPPSLQWLHVMGCCPELETQIRVKDSPEWSTISHIPRVHIKAAVKPDQSRPHIFHGIYASL
ncbi:putative disease resistance protein [Dichanthelium oligosanthes]|uniref:Putative disease resistance protein n=1 Tax=Dichanthelium oligosanthes TaxID=888268 RepID=A0A1E5V4H7_9POAL|nr:putative disease resistance protein [Dichanthelium oligosanthes]